MKTGGARKAGGRFPRSGARRGRLPASTGAGAHAGRAGRGAAGPYEALGSVVHEAQLEALLVAEALGQRVPHVVRGQGLLPAVLELREHGLRKDRRA